MASPLSSVTVPIAEMTSSILSASDSSIREVILFLEAVKMKKLMAFMLAAALALSLAACGGKNEAAKAVDQMISEMLTH